MVGDLADTVRRYGGHTGDIDFVPVSVPMPQRIEVEMTKEQFETVRGQWNESTRHAPTELVLTVDGEPVGVLRVIASHLVEPSAGGSAPV